MTSFPATKLRRPAAFTLIELMVTVAIIALILGILLPVLVGARKKALRTRMAMDLQNISQGLEAYRQDFRDYPRIDYLPNIASGANNPITATDRLGAVTLCWALVAPGPATGPAPSNAIGAAGSDGADGPGFRIRGNQGQVYGPYIQPGKYNITGTSDWDSTINDAHGNPYLYFPGNRGADIHNAPPTAGGYVGVYVGNLTTVPVPPSTTTSTIAPMYNYADNIITINNKLFTEAQMQTALGDTDTSGAINGAEIPATTGPYLLWGAGPDDAYGAPLLSNGTYGTSDDVTNFN